MIQQKSQRQVASALGIGQTSVRRLLNKYGIQSRTDAESRSTPDFIARQNELAQRYKDDYTKYITKTCEWCGGEFITSGAQRKNRFCSEACLRNWQRSFRKKQYCVRCGKEIISGERYIKRKYCNECVPIHRSESQINRIQTECGYCHKTLYVIPSAYNQNKFCYCDKNCMAKHYAELYHGENSPSWKGGNSHHYIGNYFGTRREIRERDNYTCQRCGITETEYGQEMSVHHIKNYKLFEDKYQANEKTNLVCLCEKCHRFVHSKRNIEGLFIDND